MVESNSLGSHGLHPSSCTGQTVRREQVFLVATEQEVIPSRPIFVRYTPILFLSLLTSTAPSRRHSTTLTSSCLQVKRGMTGGVLSRPLEFWNFQSW